jgi:ATP-binding cassette subfamily C protein CydD
VLRNLHWSLPRAGKFAIAGASGSGKSTLFALLTQSLTPISGRLQIAKELQMAWVPQRVHLFQRSLRDNLWLMPNAPATHDDLAKQALARVGLLEFVESLPDGLNTLAGDNGTRLSGGQQRRLALARAFVGKPDWIFLDEPEAHLDQDSLLSLENALFQGNENVLVVSHRAQTLQQCEKVLYLENGEIVDFAAHQDLLTRHIRYRQLMEGK